MSTYREKPSLANRSQTEGAYNEAQLYGESATLCNDGNFFQELYEDCMTCLSSGDSSDEVVADYLDDLLGDYIAYCANENTGKSVTTTSTLTIPRSFVSIYETSQPVSRNLTQFSGGVELATYYSTTNTTVTLPAYTTHLLIYSLISDYIPPGVFKELATSVSSAASVAHITGDPTSLIYLALEDASPPGWFVSAVPSTYAAQMTTLEDQINALRSSTSYIASISSTSTSVVMPSSTTTAFQSSVRESPVLLKSGKSCNHHPPTDYMAFSK